MHEHWILLACATFCAAAPVIAADTYPVKTVRVVAPFAPGGGSDTVARTVAQQFAEQLGKSFVVDNRTGGKRSPALPEVPSMSEAGVSGMVIYSWAGLLAPAGVPKTLVNKLHSEITKMLAVPVVQERFAAQDAELIGSRPEAFSLLLQSEIQRWAGVIRNAGIKPN